MMILIEFLINVDIDDDKSRQALLRLADAKSINEARLHVQGAAEECLAAYLARNGVTVTPRS